MALPDPVWSALADPTRRQLLDQLSVSGPLTATELAPDYPLTRQAVVKHLSALAGAGLLEARRQGREVRYEVVSEPLEDAAEWLAEVGSRWDQRLEALSRKLSAEPSPKPGPKLSLEPQATPAFAPGPPGPTAPSHHRQ